MPLPFILTIVPVALECRHHLYTRMLGNVVYVRRTDYADRSKMLSSYASQLETCGMRSRLAGAQHTGRMLMVYSVAFWCHLVTCQATCFCITVPACPYAFEGTQQQDGLHHISICIMVLRKLRFIDCPAGDKRVAVVPEGAAQPEALLGTARLVKWLAEESELSGRRCHIFVDSGTGATAIGERFT